MLLSLASVCLLMLISACRKKDFIENTSNPQNKQVLSMLDSIYLYASQIYFWNDQLPKYKTFNPSRFYDQGSEDIQVYRNEIFELTRYAKNPQSGVYFFKEKRPLKKQISSLAIVALGVVVGFPLLSALALQYVTSAHSIVFIGLLPLVTAVFGIVSGGERPKPLFWVFSITGSLLVVGYAFAQGLVTSPTGDLFMLGAIILCGLGYAEGAKLSKTLGGWQVISWALVLSLPLTLFFCILFS